MNLYLRMQTTTDVFTDKEDSSRGIITVSDKEIQARNEARISQNTKRATSWSTRVWDDWFTERNSLPINDSDTFVVVQTVDFKDTLQFRTVVLAEQLIFRGPQWKAMNHRLRKSAKVRQKKTLLSFSNCSVVLIFPKKHL